MYDYFIAAVAATSAGGANGISAGSLRIHELSFLAVKVERIRAHKLISQSERILFFLRFPSMISFDRDSCRIPLPIRMGILGR